MRRLAFLLIGLVTAWGCGTSDGTPERRPGRAAPPPPAGVGLAPAPVSAPVAVTAPGAPGGVTGAVGLAAPALPGALAVLRLQARLAPAAGTGPTAVLSSRLAGESPALAAVAPGRYTLTYLDEGGAATPFTTSVTVRGGTPTLVRAGAVLVAPESAVHADRTGTQALTYRIEQAGGVLRTLRADVGTAVVVPPGVWSFTALGQAGGELPAVTLPVGQALVRREWGSVFVRKNAGDVVTLSSSAGVTLIPSAADEVEYLLPATDQAHGCMVYLGIVNRLTTSTITLCQDALLHADLRSR